MKRKNVSSIMVGQIPFQRFQPQGKMVQRFIGKGLCVIWEVGSVKSVLWVLGNPNFFPLFLLFEPIARSSPRS